MKRLSQFEKRFEPIDFLVLPDYSTFSNLPLWQQKEAVGKIALCGAFCKRFSTKAILPNVPFGKPSSFEFCTEWLEEGTDLFINVAGMVREKEDRYNTQQFIKYLVDNIKPRLIVAYTYSNRKSNERLFEYAVKNSVKVWVPNNWFLKLHKKESNYFI